MRAKIHALIPLWLLVSTFSYAVDFRVRLQSDPKSFDWHQAQTQMETPIVMNIMEGLVEFDQQMKVKPRLASSWTVSKDQRVYTFKLREDVKWSDGKPMVAADFTYAWKRLLLPQTASPYAYLLFGLENAKDFNSRKITDFEQVGVKAVNPHTLQVTLAKPISYFVQLLTFWTTFPMRQDVVEKHGVAWAKPGNSVVLGPFIPISYQPQSQITLKRNSHYYGPVPKIDNVIFKIIDADTTALDLFKAGQLDMVYPINPLELGSLSSGSSGLHHAPYLRTCYLNFNTSKYPINLPKVRQAIAMALDKNALAKALHSKVEPAHSFVPANILPEGKDMALVLDPENAKKRLDEVGIMPATLGKIELTAYSSDSNAYATQAIQEQLRKNLGLKIDINLPEFKMYRTQLELKTSHIFIRCWGADYPDPDSYLQIFLSDSGNNTTAWKDNFYDMLVNRAAELPDGAERKRLYRDALNILLRKEAVIAPLYFDTLVYLLNPKVQGFRLNALNYAYYRDVQIKP